MWLTAPCNDKVMTYRNKGNYKPWPILVGGDSVEDILGELKEVFPVRVDVPCRHLGWIYLHGDWLSPQFFDWCMQYVPQDLLPYMQCTVSQQFGGNTCTPQQQTLFTFHGVRI